MTTPSCGTELETLNIPPDPGNVQHAAEAGSADRRQIPVDPAGCTPNEATDRHGAQGEPATASPALETASGASIGFTARPVPFYADEWIVTIPAGGQPIARLRWGGDRYLFWPGVASVFTREQLEEIARFLAAHPAPQQTGPDR